MNPIGYFRVATEAQRAEMFATPDIANKEVKIKTVCVFNDGTTKELSDDEIRNIYRSYLQGDKYIRIKKPKKKFDFCGKVDLKGAVK